MELKLSVSIGATLQVKNAKGEWDWIKPEVGAEISLTPDDLATQAALEQEEELVDDNTFLQLVFGNLWDNVVGPQFANVVKELIAEPVAVEKPEAAVEDTTTDDKIVESTTVSTDEDDYY
jgi:hypothetical protein